MSLLYFGFASISELCQGLSELAKNVAETRKQGKSVGKINPSTVHCRNGSLELLPENEESSLTLFQPPEGCFSDPPQDVYQLSTLCCLAVALHLHPTFRPELFSSFDSETAFLNARLPDVVSLQWLLVECQISPFSPLMSIAFLGMHPSPLARPKISVLIRELELSVPDMSRISVMSSIRPPFGRVLAARDRYKHEMQRIGELLQLVEEPGLVSDVGLLSVLQEAPDQFDVVCFDRTPHAL